MVEDYPYEGEAMDVEEDPPCAFFVETKVDEGAYKTQETLLGELKDAVEDLREQFKQQLAGMERMEDTQDTCGQSCPCIESCSRTLGETRRVFAESDDNRLAAQAHRDSA